jgi:hypothetical protein
MSRKAKPNPKNMGGTYQDTIDPFFDGPQLAQARTSISMLERVLLNLLRSEIDRLKTDQPELDRYFSHFFDPTAGDEDRARFVTNFMREPPVVVLGYPRAAGEFPCFSIILESEEETTPELVGDYAGMTLDGEEGPLTEYEGGFFSHTYGIYVYAQNPDQVLYLYQFAKMVLFGAKQALECAGFINTRFSGGEISPEEMYLPENMYARVLRLQCVAPITVPRLTGGPAVITAIHMHDIVVDGLPGGVTPYAVEDDGDG